jgi:hypothetical protein
MIKILGYKGYYIDNNFNIVSKKNGKKHIMKCHIRRVGYYYVTLRKNTKHHNLLIHRIIATAFISNPENKPQVNHINGIKTDNRLENLEWVTAQENTIHGYNAGLHNLCQGEKHHWSKLKKKDVIEIRRRKDNGEKSITIAKDFNIARCTVNRINSRKSWRHL